MVYKLFDKKSKGSGIISMSNQQLANGLHKSIIRKFKKRKDYSFFKDSIWGVDLADMQLISNCNKEIRYLLCVIELFSRYVSLIPLKDKKGVTTVNAFQSNLRKSNRKPNKRWVDHASKFYNKSFKKMLEDNGVKMYLTSNEGKSIVAERFIST